MRVRRTGNPVVFVVTEDGMLRRGGIAFDGISADAPLRVLYVAGCGRSGSTILDTVLGNHPGIESVGEACHVVTNAWLREDAYCACGKPGRECDFWREVHSHWHRRVGQVDLAGYMKTARAVESSLRISVTQRCLAAGEPRHLEYLRLTVGLLAAIRDVSGAQVVVDSSKTPSRALALSMAEGVDLRLIHMVRDCRGVFWSGKKRFRKDERAGISKDDEGKGVVRAMKAWTAANLITGQLRRCLPKEYSIRLRYEDLITQPGIELRRIGDLVGMDLEPLAAAVAGGQPMSIGHTIAGNRLRMAGSVQLRPDVEWVEKLTWREQAACWALAGWLMKAYGYRWRANLPDTADRRRAA